MAEHDSRSENYYFYPFFTISSPQNSGFIPKTPLGALALKIDHYKTLEGVKKYFEKKRQDVKKKRRELEVEGLPLFLLTLPRITETIKLSSFFILVFLMNTLMFCLDIMSN